MKIVILAGGFGTRISEESQFKPKPMMILSIPVGNFPSNSLKTMQFYQELHSISDV